MSTWSFEKFFGIEPMNTRMTGERIRVTRDRPRRFVIISDSHICRAEPENPEPSKVRFLAELENLIAFEHPTDVIHLGDIIDQDASDPIRLLASCLGSFQAMKARMWTVSGNHDRAFFEALTCAPHRNLHVSGKLALAVCGSKKNQVHKILVIQ